MNRPYRDSRLEDYILREFSSNIEKEELMWHRDDADRIIEVISGEGWRIQLENQLPVPLIEGKNFFIKKDEWHRLLKGKSVLRIKIFERNIR